MMRSPTLVFLFYSLCATTAGANADDETPRARADALAESMKPDELERAIGLYEQLLQEMPDNFGLLLGAAATMNKLMSIRTHQNLPYIEDGSLELSDTSQNKKIWRRWGERASQYAKRALEQRPKNVEAAFAYANAYMFHSSSMGIVSAILNGAASTYEENAERLIRLAPSYEDGVGYFFMAAFYLVAPWPMSDYDDSRNYLRKALSAAPDSLRNHYLLGVLEFEESRWDQARGEFQRVVERPCRGPSEKQICRFIKRRSKIALQEIAKERD